MVEPSKLPIEPQDGGKISANEEKPKHAVIVIGSLGDGKTTIINALLGRSQFLANDSTTGVTNTFQFDRSEREQL